MTAVWDHATDVSGSTLVVLLAMADWAGDDGGGVYPSQGRLAKKTRMSDRNVRNCLEELEERGYIERVGKRGHLVEWRVDPHPEKIATRNEGSGSSGTRVPTDTSTMPSKGEADASPSKVRDLKDVYGEPETPGSAAAPWLVLELARLMRSNDNGVRLPVGLREAVKDWQSTPAGDRTPAIASGRLAAHGWHTSLKAWLDAARLLIDADGRGAREVAEVLRWSQADAFWSPNIHSMTKFRDKYDQLRPKALDEISSTRPADRRPATREQLDALAGRDDSPWKRNGVCPWALRAGEGIAECGRSYGHEGAHVGTDEHGMQAQWPSTNPDAYNREET
jgi:hypothetical protein